MSIFPFIENAGAANVKTMPLLRDIKTDDKGNPIYKNGEPQFTEGREAIKSWCGFALLTERKKHIALRQSYGSDIKTLIGKGFTPGVTESEAKRYVKECLLQNPYIKNVRDMEVEFSGAVLKIAATLNTEYGEVTINV